MRPTRDPKREKDEAEAAQATAEFLAKGGKIQTAECTQGKSMTMREYNMATYKAEQGGDG
jgi:hypothetical protein